MKGPSRLGKPVLPGRLMLPKWWRCAPGQLGCQALPASLATRQPPHFLHCSHTSYSAATSLRVVDAAKVAVAEDQKINSFKHGLLMIQGELGLPSPGS